MVRVFVKATFDPLGAPVHLVTLEVDKPLHARLSHYAFPGTQYEIVDCVKRCVASVETDINAGSVFNFNLGYYA